MCTSGTTRRVQQQVFTLFSVIFPTVSTLVNHEHTCILYDDKRVYTAIRVQNNGYRLLEMNGLHYFFFFFN